MRYVHKIQEMPDISVVSGEFIEWFKLSDLNYINEGVNMFLEWDSHDHR